MPALYDKLGQPMNTQSSTSVPHAWNYRNVLRDDGISYGCCCINWRLSVVGEVESAVKVSLVRAGRLRQSALKSAFEGRL